MIVILLAGACSAAPTAVPASPTPEPSPTRSATFTPSATWTLTPSPSATAVPSHTPTITPTFTPSPTPPPLSIWTTTLLRGAVTIQPVSYLQEPCFYLARRWAPDASQPGTVVVPVMFHSITKDGRPISDPKDISETEFQNFMYYANRLGFKTITTEQLKNFLLHNAPIPVFSMILILDDRRPGVIYNNFMPLLEKYDWKLTPAYIADPDHFGWAMDWMETLNESGRLDVQSHGYTGELYITGESSEAEIRHEILDSTAVIEEHFGHRPQAFIWPGGNFTPQAVKIAREGGYQLGFTAYSRGPLMFNWIPQGELEQAVNDPLMLLPRAWSNSMPVNLDQAMKISAQASDQAEQSFAQDAQYYQTYCGGELSR